MRPFGGQNRAAGEEPALAGWHEEPASGRQAGDRARCPGQGHEDDGCVGNRAQLGRRRRDAVDQQAGAAVAGRREHDGVGYDRPICRLELAAVRRPPQGGHFGSGPEAHVSLFQVGDEPRDHAAEPSQQPEKQRLAAPAPATVRPRRAGQHGPERVHHAPLTDEVMCDLRCDNREGQLFGAAGVDPAEQRVDETPDDLVAEPTLENRGDCPLRLAGVGRAGQAAGALPGPPGGVPAAASIGRAQPQARGPDRFAWSDQIERSSGDPGGAHDP